MDKLMVGMVTFGNLKYTKMSINALRENTDTPFELVVVAGKLNDGTSKFCQQENIYCIEHQSNLGFPKSINDIYEYSWIKYPQCSILIMGNDVLPYKNSIDTLVEIADTTDYEWISGVEASNPKKLILRFPEYGKLFEGKSYNLKSDNFDGWKKLKLNYTGNITNLHKFSIIGDSHNLCLFKRSLFDKIGFVDVDFYPAYFEDNDYGRRARLANCKMARVSNAPYFHFWSRTIHEADMKKTNDKFFPMNRKYYETKWGGTPGAEKWKTPFNGSGHNLGKINLAGTIKITSREKEVSIINYWRGKK